jgi:hypothetical protein
MALIPPPFVRRCCIMIPGDQYCSLLSVTREVRNGLRFITLATVAFREALLGSRDPEDFGLRFSSSLLGFGSISKDGEVLCSVPHWAAHPPYARHSDTNALTNNVSNVVWK